MSVWSSLRFGMRQVPAVCSATKIDCWEKERQLTTHVDAIPFPVFDRDIAAGILGLWRGLWSRFFRRAPTPRRFGAGTAKSICGVVKSESAG